MASEDVKGVTPKGDQLAHPTYKANAKSLGTEGCVKSVSGDASFGKDPKGPGVEYKGLASPLKE